jgi:hypothetical protein
VSARARAHARASACLTRPRAAGTIARKRGDYAAASWFYKKVLAFDKVSARGCAALALLHG